MASFHIHRSLQAQIDALAETDVDAAAMVVLLCEFFGEQCAAETDAPDWGEEWHGDTPAPFDVVKWQAAYKRGYRMLRLKYFNDNHEPYGHRLILAFDQDKEIYHAIGLYPRKTVYATPAIWRELSRRYRDCGI